MSAQEEHALAIRTLAFLFEKRDETYKVITNKIIEKLSGAAMECIEEFLTRNGLKTANSTIMWNDVHLIENMIAMAGIIRYNSNMVSPTVDDLPHGFGMPISDSERMFVVQLPLQLAACGTREEITDFLNQTINEEELKNARMQATQHNTLADFDLNALSDEQKRNLFFPTAIPGEKGASN